MPLESIFDETFVARLAAAEKQVQQSYRPVIGVHKWFARRPGTLFRALMLSELTPLPLEESFFDHHEFDRVVLDPFMGGGTTLFEANRLGLSVAGYDTNPMSRWICERELEDFDVEEFEEVGERVCLAVEKKLERFYVTECEECAAEVPVKSFLWVKVHSCDCGHDTLLFSGSLVAGRGMKRHTHEVLVCGHCRSVSQFLPGEVPESCPQCDALYADTRVKASGTCECGKAFSVPAKNPEGPPGHALFALEYHCQSCKKRDGRRGRFFKGADARDHQRFATAAKQFGGAGSKFIPQTLIPDGDETKRLHRWGYEKFQELHNDRQLLGLSTLAEEITRQPDHLQPALATVFSDFIRYQNMVCRYDTAALKILDVFSIHAFPVQRVQCEAALIGLPRIGSGGYRHFLRKYAAAKRYCQRPFETTREEARKTRVEIDGETIAAKFVRSPDQLHDQKSALLRCASLTDEPMPADSVDLVLTDPPYFAMVQYSELMDFCYAWLRELSPDTPYFANGSSKSASEVTGNETQGRGLEAFAEALSGVYQAAAAALKPGRLFAFTYHHNDLKSYAAIVVACLDSDLIPITTLPCPSEMRGSVHISKSGSSRVDTVFVLRKPPAAMPVEASEAIGARVETEAQHLLDADLLVSEGDRRCLRYGLIAATAIRELASDWDRSVPIEVRVKEVVMTLSALDVEQGPVVPDDPPISRLVSESDPKVESVA
jgi:putative DNA methylase